MTLVSKCLRTGLLALLAGCSGGATGGAGGTGGVAASGGQTGGGGRAGSGGPAGSGGHAGSGGRAGAGGAAGSGQGGMAGGSAGAGGKDPLNAAPACTSGVSWTGTDGNTPLMRPGEACGATSACHGSGAATFWVVGGTVYPTGHEPDDCNGYSNPISNNVGIVITDASGGVLNLAPNPVGNFYYAGTLSFPIKAKLVSFVTGAVREMVAPVATGDCNSCHTQDGANLAPGRITVPF